MLSNPLRRPRPAGFLLTTPVPIPLSAGIATVAQHAQTGFMATVIFNCKRCKSGRRVEYPLHDRFGAFRLSVDGRRIDPCVYVQACGGGKPTVYGGDTEMGLCSTCGRAMKYGTLKGHVNPAQKCDARCTSARGHNCECQCGGENHGTAWAA